METVKEWTPYAKGQVLQEATYSVVVDNGFGRFVDTVKYDKEKGWLTTDTVLFYASIEPYKGH